MKSRRWRGELPLEVQDLEDEQPVWRYPYRQNQGRSCRVENPPLQERKLKTETAKASGKQYKDQQDVTTNGE